VIILLLGAQVISEFDRHRYEAARNEPPAGEHNRG